MVWDDFSFCGNLQFCFISTKMNFETYVEMLEDVLVNYLEDNLDKDMTLQQDNNIIMIIIITIKQYIKERRTN